MSEEIKFDLNDGLISDRECCEIRWSDLNPTILAALVRAGTYRAANTVRQQTDDKAEADKAERQFWAEVRSTGKMPSRGGARVSLEVQCWREIVIDQLGEAGHKATQAGTMARKEPDKAIKEITKHLVRKAGAEATKARIDANAEKVAASIDAKTAELVKLRQQKDDSLTLDI